MSEMNQVGKKNKRRKGGGEEDTTPVEEDPGPDLFHLYRLESKKLQAAYFQGCGLGIPCRRENIIFIYIYIYIL